MNGLIIPNLLILCHPCSYWLFTSHCLYINTPLSFPHSLLLRRRTNVRNVSKYPSSLRCLIYIFITIVSYYDVCPFIRLFFTLTVNLSFYSCACQPTRPPVSVVICLSVCFVVSLPHVILQLGCHPCLYEV